MVLATVFTLVLVSLVFSLFQDRVYEAEATVSVEPEGELSSGQDVETFVNEVFRAADTRELRLEAMREAGWRAGERSFERQRSVQAFARQDGEEAGLLIQFAASDADEAARAANASAALLVERVAQLNDRLAGGSLAATASMQEKAAPPQQPSSPRPLVYALIAAGAGLLAGGASALMLEGRTQSWRGARDAELTLMAPVIGVIPEYSGEEEEA